MDSTKYRYKGDNNSIESSTTKSNDGLFEFKNPTFRKVMKGVVRTKNKGGYIVEAEGHSCFLPLSHAPNKYRDKDSTIIGKEYSFVVLEERDNGSYILSSEEFRKYRSKLYNELCVNDIVKGIIISLNEFYIKVCIGGCIFGYIRSSDVHNNNVISIYKEIEVAILSKDDEEHHLKLGLMEVENTYIKKELESIAVGTIVNGTVISFSENGVFIKFGHLQGFIHQDELYLESQANKKKLTVGSNINAMILGINGKDITLSMKRVLANDILSAFADIERGSIVEGVVSGYDKNNVYVSISGYPGIIRKENLSIGYSTIKKEVFPGQIMDMVLLSKENGILSFDTKILKKDVYSKDLYLMDTYDLLSQMKIRSNKFFGLLIKTEDANKNSKWYLSNLCVDSNGDDEGLLLCDPITGNPIWVFIPDFLHNLFIVEGYYNVCLCSGNKKARERKNSPFYFVIDTVAYTPVPVANPYKRLVNNTFKKQTSPSSNASLASLLDEVGQNMYDSKQRMFFELLQNADDASSDNGVQIIMQITQDYLLLTHNGMPFNRKDFVSITSAARSTKSNQKKKTGYKGIGFKSVFSESTLVMIKSGGFEFMFDKQKPLYYKFEDFYFEVNNISSEMEKKNYLEIFKDEKKEFNGIKSIPWQLLPIWVESYPKQLHQTIFSTNENVVIALNMPEEAINSYKTAIFDVLSDPKFMLFLRNTKRIQLIADNCDYFLSKINKDGIVQLQSTLSGTGVRRYLTKSFDDIAVNDDTFLTSEVHIAKKKILNPKNNEKEWVFVDSNGSNITNIPPRIACTDNTQVSFAVELDADNRFVIPKNGSSLFAYLPMEEKRYMFPMFINADFILKSSREGIQGENPWNHFLFYQIGLNYCKWVGQLASPEQPDYLKLLLTGLFDEDTAGMKILSNYFNKGYRLSINREDYILNSDLKLVNPNQIVIDTSGLSDIIGSSHFLFLLSEEERRLPYHKIDKTIYKSPLFSGFKTVGLTDIGQVVKDKSKLKYIRYWFSTAGKDNITRMVQWLHTNFDNTVISAIPLYNFNGRFHSYADVQECDNLIICNRTFAPVSNILTKIGLSCSDTFTDCTHHAFLSYTRAYNVMAIKRILCQTNDSYNKLDSVEKVKLFSIVTDFQSNTPPTETIQGLGKWELFCNSNGKNKALASLRLAKHEAAIDELVNYLLSENTLDDNISNLIDVSHAQLFLNDGKIYTECIIPDWPGISKRWIEYCEKACYTSQQKKDIYNFIRFFYNKSTVVDKKSFRESNLPFVLTNKGFTTADGVYYNDFISDMQLLCTIEKIVSKDVPLFDCLPYLKQSPCKLRSIPLSATDFISSELTAAEIEALVNFCNRNSEDFFSLFAITEREGTFTIRKMTNGEWYFAAENTQWGEFIVDKVKGAIRLPGSFTTDLSPKYILSGERLFSKVIPEIDIFSNLSQLLPVIERESDTVKRMFVDSLPVFGFNNNSFDNPLCIKLFNIISSITYTDTEFNQVRQKLSINDNGTQKSLASLSLQDEVKLAGVAFKLSDLQPQNIASVYEIAYQTLDRMRTLGYKEPFLCRLFNLQNQSSSDEIFKYLNTGIPLTSGAQLAFIILYTGSSTVMQFLNPYQPNYKKLDFGILTQETIVHKPNTGVLFLNSISFVDKSFILHEKYRNFTNYITSKGDINTKFGLTICRNFLPTHMRYLKSDLSEHDILSFLDCLYTHWTNDSSCLSDTNLTASLMKRLELDNSKQVWSCKYALASETLPPYVVKWIMQSPEQHSRFISAAFKIPSDENDFVQIRSYLSKGDTITDPEQYPLSKMEQKKVGEWITSKEITLSKEQYEAVKIILSDIICMYTDFSKIKKAINSNNPIRTINSFTIYEHNGQMPQICCIFDNYVLYAYTEGDIASNEHSIYVNCHKIDQLDNLLISLAADSSSLFSDKDLLVYFKENIAHSKKSEVENHGNVVEKGKVSEEQRSDINRTARFASKEYLEGIDGFDCSEWDPENSGHIVTDKVKYKGKPIVVVVTSSVSQKLHLHPWAFAELMQSPDNLLLNYDQYGTVHSLGYEDIFKDNPNVNLVFDTDVVSPKFLAKLANEFMGSQRTAFVIENPKYSAHEELKFFGLNEKKDGTVRIDFDENSIFDY